MTDQSPATTLGLCMVFSNLEPEREFMMIFAIIIVLLALDKQFNLVQKGANTIKSLHVQLLVNIHAIAKRKDVWL